VDHVKVTTLGGVEWGERSVIPAPFLIARRRGITTSWPRRRSRKSFHRTRACALPSNFRRRRRDWSAVRARNARH